MTLDDPDAPLLMGFAGPCIGPASSVPGGNCLAWSKFAECPRYGPWDPPAKEAYHKVISWHHTFDKAGTYFVYGDFTTTSYGGGCDLKYEPYSSRDDYKQEFTVVPDPNAPPPTTSTTACDIVMGCQGSSSPSGRPTTSST